MLPNAKQHLKGNEMINKKLHQKFQFGIKLLIVY